MQLIDKKAANVDDKERIFETIVTIGLSCTKDKYEERPDMVTVLNVLERTLYFDP